MSPDYQWIEQMLASSRPGRRDPNIKNRNVFVFCPERSASCCAPPTVERRSAMSAAGATAAALGCGLARSAAEMVGQMRMHKATRITLWLAAVVVVIVAMVSVALILPGTPSGSSSLRFQGFVFLPGKGTIQVLDLFAVYKRALFATNISTGDVYKIVLRGDRLPSSADVLVFGREPAAHAVAVDSISGMAFVTRSAVNAID